LGRPFGIGSGRSGQNPFDEGALRVGVISLAACMFGDLQVG
jgi:hypothetical protein